MKRIIDLNMKFYRKNSTIGVDVCSKQEIIAYMGEIGNSIQSIDVTNNGLVIGYIGGQGVVLGYLKEG